jgi:hypothetical protein
MCLLPMSMCKTPPPPPNTHMQPGTTGVPARLPTPCPACTPVQYCISHSERCICVACDRGYPEPARRQAGGTICKGDLHGTVLPAPSSREYQPITVHRQHVRPITHAAVLSLCQHTSQHVKLHTRSEVSAAQGMIPLTTATTTGGIICWPYADGCRSSSSSSSGWGKGTRPHRSSSKSASVISDHREPRLCY